METAEARAGRLRLVARELAAPLRDRPAPLDHLTVAASLGIRRLSHRFAGPSRGAALAGDTIVLDARLRGPRRDLVFAHEIAHVLLQRRVVVLEGAEAELFADVFASELLIPSAWALPSETLLEAADRFRVDRRITHWHLAVRCDAPALQAVGRSLVCRFCGWRRHSQRCVCGHTSAVDALGDPVHLPLLGTAARL